MSGAPSRDHASAAPESAELAERLVAECLAASEKFVNERLDAMCREHPGAAPRIREQELRSHVEAVDAELVDGYQRLGDQDPAGAVLAFGRAMTLAPESAEAVAGQVYALLRLDRSAEALALLDRHRRSSDRTSSFLQLRIDVLRKLKRSGEADDLSRSLTEPDDALGFSLEGSRELVRAESGIRSSFRRAVGLLQRAVLSTSPARPLFYYRLAQAVGQTNEDDLARSTASSILALWPESPSAWRFAAWAWRRSDPGRVIPALERAVTLGSDRHGAFENLVVALLEADRCEEAIAACDQGLGRNPESASLWNHLGVVRARQGRMDDAVVAARRAVELAPESATPRMNLGSVLTEAGHPEEALDHLEKAVALEPGSGETQYNLGVALLDLGRVEEAISAFERCLQIDPRNVNALNNLGRALLNHGQSEEAVAAFNNALEIDPRHVGALHNLGYALMNHGSPGEAVDVIQKAIEVQPGKAGLRENLAVAYRLLGRLDEALLAWRDAVAHEPSSAKAWSGLSRALRAESACAESLAALRRGVEAQDQGTRGEEIAAAEIEEAGRLADEEERLLEAFENGGTPEDATTLVALAGSLGARGRDAEAVEIWARAFESEPKLLAHPRTWYRYRAARSAVRATGKSKTDAAPLRLRAVEWFEADLRLWKELLDAGRVSDEEAAAGLRRWLHDPALEGVRGAGASGGLTEAERDRWKALWAGVESMLGDLE